MAAGGERDEEDGEAEEKNRDGHFAPVVLSPLLDFTHARTRTPISFSLFRELGSQIRYYYEIESHLAKRSLAYLTGIPYW